MTLEVYPQNSTHLYTHVAYHGGLLLSLIIFLSRLHCQKMKRHVAGNPELEGGNHGVLFAAAAEFMMTSRYHTF